MAPGTHSLCAGEGAPGGADIRAAVGSALMAWGRRAARGVRTGSAAAQALETCLRTVWAAAGSIGAAFRAARPWRTEITLKLRRVCSRKCGGRVCGAGGMRAPAYALLFVRRPVAARPPTIRTGSEGRRRGGALHRGSLGGDAGAPFSSPWVGGRGPAIEVGKSRGYLLAL